MKITLADLFGYGSTRAGLAIQDGSGNSAPGVALFDESGNPIDGLNPLPATLAASENLIGKTVGVITNPSASFTRPANTTGYAIAQLIANNTVAASVAAMQFTAARVPGGSFMVRRARILKSGTLLTNASFRLHLYAQAPASIANGDGGAWSTSAAGYVGSLDVTISKAFTDGAMDVAIPSNGNELSVTLPSGAILYGLLEARAAYVPISGEVFTVTLELHQY